MKEVLIVGAGLSGICLSYQFLQRGINITLIDNSINHSSKVAAGMINPLVFRRMTKSWRIDEMLPFAQEFYHQLENELSCHFYHPITIRRFFSSEQERNFWIDKQTNPEFQAYMHQLDSEDENIHSHANQFGSGRVKNSAHIDTSSFLDATLKDLKQKVTYIQTHCDYTDFSAEKSTYKDQHFDLIVFAEGYLGIANPWFNHLPLTQTKGETLTVEFKNLETNESLNRKCFLLPMDNQTFKIGSTYTWDDATLNPTDEGKDIILENLTFLTKEVPRVISHDAGVRPTTVDRRPLIGVHPTHQNLAIFNGLGAKGYLIAPLLAYEFVESITANKPFNKECDILQRIKTHK